MSQTNLDNALSILFEMEGTSKESARYTALCKAGINNTGAALGSLDLDPTTRFITHIRHNELLHELDITPAPAYNAKNRVSREVNEIIASVHLGYLSKSTAMSLFIALMNRSQDPQSYEAVQKAQLELLILK